MMGYHNIEGVDSWTIEYAIKTILMYIEEKKGIKIKKIKDLRNDTELAMFEKACTVAFNYYDL
jgi:hypothetical protein